MIRLRQIKINVLHNNDNEIIKKCASLIKIKENDIENFSIRKRSIDARHKPDIYYIYDIDISVKDEDNILNKYYSSNIFKTPNEEYNFNNFGSEKLNKRPIVVGMGPGGLFCAYLLAINGYKPIIIERGEDVISRQKSVEEFWKYNKLNINSNVQFGEGGAGTFSDGKLNTLTNDVNYRQRFVFNTFVKYGANKDILYDNKPHIGTDILSKVVVNIREEIKRLGGSIYFNTKLTDIIINDNKVKCIVVNDKDIIETDDVVLAIGHSARDTFHMLHDKGLVMEPKPFAVGIRVMHNQDMINRSQYGDKCNLLEPASYKFTHKASNGHGVYTFCMCPGGYVVNSSSENGRLAINGMSNNKRDSGISNSAVITTISPSDYGTDLFDGVEFQERLEEKAYEIGCGLIPVQLYKDYLNNSISEKFLSIAPTFKGNYTFANINDIFPNFINESLKEGINAFGTKIKGYNMDDTVIAGVESRTSSPIRIVRNELFESNILGIYPCGEGAGYAGGIASAAMDGIKIFEAIASKYKKDS